MLRNLNHRLGHPVFTAQLANAPDAGPDLLHGFHSVQNAEQERITRNALEAESRLGHAGRQPTRADDFEPILKQVNLNVGGGAVIAMGQGIDHGFPNGLFRQF